MASPSPKAPRQRRGSMLLQAFQFTRQQDPRLPLWLAVAVVVPLAAGIALALTVGPVWAWPVIGALGAGLAFVVVLGRRMNKAQFTMLEGQPGAASAILDRMRGDWQVTPAVAVTREMDAVHRVVGRPGIVLVGEGTSAQRVRNLLAQERKRVSRVAQDAPIHEIVVGDGEGEVPLRKLSFTVMRLPGRLPAGEISEIKGRMRALAAGGPPIPKGPLPRNLKMPRNRPR